METDKLKHFCTIVEVGSLTKAAEILNISHSGLSKSMSVLQEELGVKLFVPQGRGLEVTLEGKHLYQKSKEILDLLNGLKATKKVTSSAPLKIGLSEILSLILCEELVKNLDGPIHFFQTEYGETEIRLLEGGLDFALSFLPFPHREVEHLKIKRIHFGIFSVNAHWQKLPLQELPFVIPSSHLGNNPLDLKNRDGWPLNLSRLVRYQATTLTSALNIALAGRAAIFIPKFIAQFFNQGRPLDLKLQEYFPAIKDKNKVNDLKISQALSKCSRDIFLVKKKNSEETKEMKIVAKIVRKWC